MVCNDGVGLQQDEKGQMQRRLSYSFHQMATPWLLSSTDPHAGDLITSSQCLVRQRRTGFHGNIHGSYQLENEAAYQGRTALQAQIRWRSARFAPDRAHGRDVLERDASADCKTASENQIAALKPAILDAMNSVNRLCRSTSSGSGVRQPAA